MQGLGLLTTLKDRYAVTLAVALAAIVSLSISLAYVGPHPYVVVHRVSTPYGAPRLGRWCVICAWIVLAASVLIALTLLKHHDFTVPSYALLAVCFVGCIIALVPATYGSAYVIMSLYSAGIPATLFLAPAAFVTSVALATYLATSLSLGRNPLRSLPASRPQAVWSGISLTEATLMFLIALIILLIPYYPWINPHGVLADVDHIYYMRWLEHASWNNLLRALASFNHCDRPLFLTLVFLVSQAIPFRLFDVLYIVGLGALLTVLAEYIARIAGLIKYSGFMSAMLFSIPLYFIYGGYHANLLALILCYASVATLFKALRRGSFGYGTLAFLSLMSLAIALTHSEAWVLYVPLMLVDVQAALAWILPGASWLVVRGLAFRPTYMRLTHNLISKGMLTIHNLRFQLIIMLWGVPATWVSYALAFLGAAVLLAQYTMYGKRLLGDAPPAEPRLALSMALSAVPAFVSLFLVTPKFLLHRLIMNSFLWFFTAYAISYSLSSPRLRFLAAAFIGLQSLYTVWLLVNSIPLLL